MPNIYWAELLAVRMFQKSLPSNFYYIVDYVLKISYLSDLIINQYSTNILYSEEFELSQAKNSLISPYWSRTYNYPKLPLITLKCLLDSSVWSKQIYWCSNPLKKDWRNKNTIYMWLTCFKICNSLRNFWRTNISPGVCV